MRLTKDGNLVLRITSNASSPISFGLQLGDEPEEHISMSESQTMTMIIPVKEIEGLTESKNKLKLKEITIHLGVATLKFGKY